MSTPYIIRIPNGGKARYYISPSLTAQRIDQMKPTGQTIGGFATVVEKTGKYVTDRLRLGTTAGSTDGFGRTRGETLIVKTAPAVEIKKGVRRVRPEEAELLAAADDEIAELEAQLTRVRLRRNELAAAAWTKAHVVTAKELAELF